MSSNKNPGRRPTNAWLTDSSQGPVPTEQSCEIREVLASIRKRLGLTMWNFYHDQYERLWVNHPEYDEAAAGMQFIIDHHPDIGADQNRLASILNNGILAPRVKYPTSPHASLVPASSTTTAGSSSSDVQVTVPVLRSQPRDGKQPRLGEDIDDSATPIEHLSDFTRPSGPECFENMLNFETREQQPQTFGDLGPRNSRDNNEPNFLITTGPPARTGRDDLAWARAQRFADSVDLSWLDKQDDYESNISPTTTSFNQPEPLTTEGCTRRAQAHAQFLQDGQHFWSYHG
ncbi:hypothetical protein BDV96DRAFT_605857 [Lophiotrema nucula]|uniref:Uncharacterized protein n=1 Tax=Lophiotrema nucula TaxID=690887 RepID=A0A6A5YP53_9PLEO|nr:hypothetical protein BDV96DRAFT_605857 [Lophiotrema nucula]